MKTDLPIHRFAPACLFFLVLLGLLLTALAIVRAQPGNSNNPAASPTPATVASPAPAQSPATGAKPAPSVSPSPTQTSTPATDTPTPTATTSSSPAPSPISLKVKDAFRDDPKGEEEKKPLNERMDSGLYDHIVVVVENLAQWVAQSGNNNPANFILYLDGKPLKGIRPSIDKAFENKLRYQLMRTPESKDQWDALLGRPFGFTRPVSVTVGLPGPSADAITIEPSTATMNFTMINKWGLGIFSVVAAVGLALFLKWGWNSLRDPNAAVAIEQRPYSLGRCQMAFWFFLVILSYVFIWMVTTDYGSLPGAVLILIGISAGTALGASVVNSNKRDDAEKKLENLTAERAEKLAASPVTAPDPGVPPAAAAAVVAPAAAIARINQKIVKLAPQVNPVTRGGFFSDIFRDPDGTLSFPRIQIFIWTLVLGAIFIVQVYNRLAMPDFPGTLLALMGISSGTYIGLKLPDQEP
jgi:hypothetical protein